MASGIATGYNQGNPSTPLSTIITNGSPSDPGIVNNGTTYNRSATINPPLTSASNASVGVQFSAPTTGMNAGEAVKISFSMSVGYRSSRYWQLLVSTTGTTAAGGTFSAPTGGTGSLISQFINGMDSSSNAISGTAMVGVSSSGLIDFRTINNLSLNPAQITTSLNPANYAAGFVDDISFTLPTGQGYENNANFAFAIVGLWDPSVAADNGTTGLVSSFAGTNSTDTTSGYNRSPAPGGSMRLDLMSVSAVIPEPTTSLLSVLGATMLLRRRRN